MVLERGEGAEQGLTGMDAFLEAIVHHHPQSVPTSHVKHSFLHTQTSHLPSTITKRSSESSPQLLGRNVRQQKVPVAGTPFRIVEGIHVLGQVALHEAPQGIGALFESGDDEEKRRRTIRRATEQPLHFPFCFNTFHTNVALGRHLLCCLPELLPFPLIIPDECAKLAAVEMVVEDQKEALVELEGVRPLDQELPDAVEKLRKHRALLARRVHHGAHGGGGSNGGTIASAGGKGSQMTGALREFVSERQPVLFNQRLQPHRHKKAQ